MEKRKRFKIVIAEPAEFSEVAQRQLMELGALLKGPFSQQELMHVSQDADVLILRLGHTIDEKFLENSSIRYILTPTTGLNHIDCEAAKSKNIRIISLKDQYSFLERIPSTAEHTWALMLALLRKIPAAHKHVMEGNWNRDAFKSRNLNALTLGILGFGRVGKQIARYAQAFDMTYHFFDTSETLKNHPKSVTTIEKLFSQSDVLSIHIPLNAANTGFLDKQKLNALKNGALLINTSRGEVIDENALVHLLIARKVGGVATDVLTNELYPEKRNESALLAFAKQNENVIITPHIAGATTDSMRMTEDFVVNKFLEYIKRQ